MSQVFADIDPGAGSLVIQAIIAGLVSIPFFFRNAIRSTIGRFRRKPSGSDAVRQSASTEETGASRAQPE